MAKINLPRIYIHSGKHYGPGNVEGSDELIKDLNAAVKRDAARHAKEQGEQQRNFPLPPQEQKDESNPDAQPAVK